jgi:glycosyltransferase involved in cell wall biosynthesis
VTPAFPAVPAVLLAASPLLWLAVLTLTLWLAGALDAGLGTRHLEELPRLPPIPPGEAPRVSIVVAARDEARGVEAGVRSLLAQRYPDFEVRVVDDRSEDATPEILDRLAEEDPRLRVLHLSSLPPGWLGKNHALQRGVDAAGGEWILFTDADVVLAPTALGRAVGYAVRHRLDHLAAAPELRMRGALLGAFAGAFALLFARYTRPWKARDPRSAHHIGVGAFNLVRAEAYRAAGGHRPIAMRPDDDVKLGELLKRRGARQDLVFGRGLVSVEWYHSLPEAVRGLEKNTFAGLGYSVPRVIVGCLLLVVFDAWPFAAVLVTHGPTRALYAATVVVALLLYAASTRGSGTPARLAPLYPVAILILVFTVLRATWIAVRRGGIYWRGTFYSLEELKG